MPSNESLDCTVSNQPPVSFWDTLRAQHPLIGARFASEIPRGWISPVDARLRLGLAYDNPAEVERSYFAKRSLVKDLTLVARTLVAKLLVSSDPPSSQSRIRIVSATVDNVSIDSAIERILSAPDLAGDRAKMVHFVHPHALNIATHNESLRAQLESADLVLPDGIGLQIASRLLRQRLKHNVNGTDLLPTLCRALAERKISLSLVGAAPGVAQECAERLKQAHPGLVLGAIAHGFMNEHETQEFVRKVQLVGGVVLVGMGTPIQESWAWKFLAPVKGITVLTVGGLFDFYAGKVERAPMAVREVGLEWLWRLYQEPTRLAKRYIVGNPLFLFRAMKQRLLSRPRTALAAQHTGTTTP